MRKLYILIFLAFISYQAEAQLSFIKLTNTFYALGAVIDSHQVYTIVDSVYNTSSLSYTDTVYFGARINSSAPFTLDTAVFTSGNPIDTGFAPKAVVFHLPFGNNAFVSGPNGVVIWPIYVGGHAGANDTARITVTLMYVTGIDEAPLAKMYIIQQGGDLNIQMGELQNLIQQVSLYDVTGRQVFTGSADQSRNIPTSGWTSGVYFCEITTYHGERRTIKFILQ